MQRRHWAIVSRTRWAAARAGVVLAGSALALCACSVSSPLAITSTGEGLERGASVAFAPVEDAAPLEARFTATMENALASQSILLAENANLIAQISAAQSNASNGLLSGDWAATNDEDDQNWIAQPRRDRPLDRCNAQRLRATLTIYDRATGEVVYRGASEAIECSFGDEALDAFAQGLVADAMRAKRP